MRLNLVPSGRLLPPTLPGTAHGYRAGEEEGAKPSFPSGAVRAAARKSPSRPADPPKLEPDRLVSPDRRARAAEGR